MATMLDRESRREKILSAIQKEARLKVILSTGLAIANFLLSKPLFELQFAREKLENKHFFYGQADPPGLTVSILCKNYPF